jgi:hypothetical protein
MTKSIRQKIHKLIMARLEKVYEPDSVKKVYGRIDKVLKRVSTSDAHKLKILRHLVAAVEIEAWHVNLSEKNPNLFDDFRLFTSFTKYLNGVVNELNNKINISESVIKEVEIIATTLCKIPGADTKYRQLKNINSAINHAIKGIKEVTSWETFVKDFLRCKASNTTFHRRARISKKEFLPISWYHIYSAFDILKEIEIEPSPQRPRIHNSKLNLKMNAISVLSAIFTLLWIRTSTTERFGLSKSRYAQVRRGIYARMKAFLYHRRK